MATNLITIDTPNSIISESYKMIRTNLSYYNVDKENKVILFTSSVPGEGKSTTVSNVAVTIAQSGKKVLIIESDLRRGSIYNNFNVDFFPGIVNVLASKLNIADVVKKISIVPNLSILTAGECPPNPSELLESKSFENIINEARESYDFILIDSPPVLSVADPLILSRYADGVVIVVAINETKKDDVTKTINELKKVNANIIGSIATKSEIKRKNDYYNIYTKKSKKKKKR